MNREKRKIAAEDTIEILNKGSYTVNHKKISVADELAKSIEQSLLLREQDSKPFLSESRDLSNITEYTCINESTVTAIHRFNKELMIPVGVLNFASAKNPGGGFRSGAVAQEESLAISSGLFYTQTRNRAYYDINASIKSPFYTSTAIYSPNVPFFKDENLCLTETTSLASVLTLPAVNMNLAGKHESQAFEIMKYRMRLCLSIFFHYKIEHIILGAFGCGVFKHNPANVSAWWRELFEGEFKGQFKTVHFAVLDSSKKQDNIKYFDELVKQLKNCPKE